MFFTTTQNREAHRVLICMQKTVFCKYDVTVAWSKYLYVTMQTTLIYLVPIIRDYGTQVLLIVASSPIRAAGRRRLGNYLK